MSAPRFFVSELHVGEVALDAVEARHAGGSLRLKTGDGVALLNGQGGVGHGRVATVPRGKRGELVITVEHVDEVLPPKRVLTLYVAGCKGPRLTWLVEKCTELGVTRLCFTEFERSVVRVSASHAAKLRRTAIEACKQSGRPWLPEIVTGATLDQIVAAADAARLLIADPRGDIAFEGGAEAATAVVIGPEGGLSTGEVDVLRTAGAVRVRLGDHVLRVETAAMSAAAIWASC